MNKNRAYVTYIAALLIFATNGILAASIKLESSQIVFLRTLLGGILLTLIVFIRGGFDRDTLRKEGSSILLGGIALGLNWAMLFAAYQLLNVSLATLIYYVGPILVLLLSPVLFHERLTGQKIISTLFVGIGLLLISGSILNSGMNPKGLIFAVLSAVFYAMVIVFNKKITQTSGLQTAAIELNIACVLMLVYVILSTGFPQISRSDIPYIATIGFVNTGLAYLLYFSSLQRLPGQSVALLSYIDPVAALIFSAVLLHEVMTPIQILGSVLIVSGSIIGEMKRKTKI